MGQGGERRQLCSIANIGGTGRATWAVLGYPAAGLGYWMAIGQAGLRSSVMGDVFTAGLFGIIPAAVCSWIAGGGNKAA